MQSAVKISYFLEKYFSAFDCRCVTNWNLLQIKLIQFSDIFITYHNQCINFRTRQFCAKSFQVSTSYLAKVMCMACVVRGWNVSMVDSYWQGTPNYSSETSPGDIFSVTNSRETELAAWDMKRQRCSTVSD